MPQRIGAAFKRRRARRQQPIDLRQRAGTTTPPAANRDDLPAAPFDRPAHGVAERPDRAPCVPIAPAVGAAAKPRRAPTGARSPRSGGAAGSRAKPGRSTLGRRAAARRHRAGAGAEPASHSCRRTGSEPRSGDRDASPRAHPSHLPGRQHHRGRQPASGRDGTPLRRSRGRIVGRPHRFRRAGRSARCVRAAADLRHGRAAPG